MDGGENGRLELDGLSLRSVTVTSGMRPPSGGDARSLDASGWHDQRRYMVNDIVRASEL